MDFTELKYIAEYPGYAVTADGRIYSDRLNRFLGQSYMNGYKRVKLIVGNKRKSILVHRLVASMFCYKPQGCNCVNHIDGIKDHNEDYNLEWVTQSQNVQHAWDTGLKKKPIGDLNPGSKLTWNNIQDIIKQRNDQDVPVSILAVKFNVSKPTIYNILKGKSWYKHKE